MSNVLEVAGGADIGLGELLALLVLDLLVLLVEAAMAEHVVEVVGLLLGLVGWLLVGRLVLGGVMVVVVVVGVVGAHVVDLRVLDVHRGHGESRAIWRVASLFSFALASAEQVVQGCSEPLSLLLTGKIQAYLTGISSK